MSKNQNKTTQNDNDVLEFLNRPENEKKLADSMILMEMMADVTGEPAKMWGPSIIGFGSYHYKYESGREGDMPLVGFSPRKAKFSLYIMTGFDGYEEIMSRLGKHKTGKSCLYINKLADIDNDVLRELVQKSADSMKNSQ